MLPCLRPPLESHLMMMGCGPSSGGVAIIATSYSNTGGTGNRTAIITTTKSIGFSGGVPQLSILVDGNTTMQNSCYFTGETVAGKYMRFQFGSAKVIDEAKFWQDGGAAYNHGVWKWQGSNDGSTWTDIGSSFTLGPSVSTSSPQIITALAGNQTAYTYYQLLGVSGSSNSGPYIREFEFKISA